MFRRMVNDSIRIGLVNDASSLRRLSLLSYNQLAHYDSPSYYKLCAISSSWNTSRQEEVSQERLPHQTALYCQILSSLLLRLQDQEWNIRDSELEIPRGTGEVRTF